MTWLIFKIYFEYINQELRRVLEFKNIQSET